MGKNLKGGKKHKGNKNSTSKQHKSSILSEITPDNIETYIASVESGLGSGHFTLKLQSTKEIVHASIPGSFNKRIWVRLQEYVFVQKAIDINKFFILHVYTEDELQQLNFTPEIEEEKGEFVFDRGNDMDNSNIDDI